MSNELIIPSQFSDSGDKTELHVLRGSGTIDNKQFELNACVVLRDLDIEDNQDEDCVNTPVNYGFDYDPDLITSSEASKLCENAIVFLTTIDVKGEEGELLRIRSADYYNYLQKLHVEEMVKEMHDSELKK